MYIMDPVGIVESFCLNESEKRDISGGFSISELWSSFTMSDLIN